MKIKKKQHKTWRKVKLEETESKPISFFIQEPLGGDWGKETSQEEFNQPVYAIRGTDFDDLKNGNITELPFRYIKKSSLLKRKLEIDDILLEISGGSQGQPVGRPLIINELMIKRYKYPLIYSNFCRRIRVKMGFSAKYLYFHLVKIYNSPEIYSYQTQSTGISNFHFTDFINHKEIPSFQNNEQKRIAAMLSAFDDKIELNNKINHNLEQMAQAIFKEWFVKFKFPGHKKSKFVDSELGKIPKGWEVKKITEIIKRIPVGKKYDNKNALPKGEIPILDQGQSGFIGFHNGEPGVRASIENPVIVFTNHTCYYRLLTHDFSCIQNVIPYIGCKGYPTLFIYFLTKGKVKMQEYKGHWPEFEEQVFAIPPVLLAKKFADYIQPMIRKMVGIENENQKLSSLRDLLLPKLMSGEIKV